ncbi:hypothetical protein CL658_01965 [bacterium]|nr:hypothetical protein [bacterium]|tara:strand:- start:998 stop:1975 length:978 start_codon:yes stop_codon:yes gene_type:complete
MKKTILILLIGLTTTTFADNLITKRVDSHAPISIMNDHNHTKSEIMTSYRLMTMTMDGNIQGNNDITMTDITNTNYMMAPQSMTMTMHMIGIMYGLTKQTTLMAMSSYQEKDMTMINKMNQSSNSRTTGLSDLKLSALQTISKTDKQSWIAHIGLSLPIGSIDETDDNNRLAYPMQLGSGTVDVVLGTTYTKFIKSFSLGSQISNIIRTGKNKHQYRLGHSFSVITWLAKPITNNWSISLRLTRLSNEDINGSDSSLNTMMSPTTSTNTGNVIYTTGIGSNIKFSKQYLKGARLAIELTKPISQNVNGIQMKNKYSYTIGYQQAF